jgi:hypothetical protein
MNNLIGLIIFATILVCSVLNFVWLKTIKGTDKVQKTNYPTIIISSLMTLIYIGGLVITSETGGMY